MNRDEIAAAIKQKRRLLNLTQKDLADKIGTKPQRIAEIESAKTNVSIDRLIEIAEAIGLKIILK